MASVAPHDARLPPEVHYPGWSLAAPLWSVEVDTWARAGVQAALAGLPRPDGLVVDPFARHPALLVEAHAAGRSAVAANLDPTALLALRLSLAPPSPRALDVAFTRLADARIGGSTLTGYVEAMWRSACPFCGASLTVDAWVWDDEAGVVVEKSYRCRACGAQGGAPATVADRELAASVEAKGPRYWQLLGRLVTPQDELTARAEELVGIYTARSRLALLALALQIESAVADGDEQRLLRGLLLSTLERGHSLHAPGAPAVPSRPSRLRLPRRYVEHNIWRLFEEAYRTLRQRATVAPAEAMRWADRLPPEPGRVLLRQVTAREMAPALPPESIDLVITEVPRPDPVAYGLAFLWTGWLFGRATTALLRPLAARRGIDWDWYSDALGAVLETLADRLHPAGRVVLTCTATHDEQLTAMLAASDRAALRLAGASAVDTGSGTAHRLLFTRRRHARSPADSDAARQQGEQAALAALAARAQPTPAWLLACAIQWAWARTDAAGVPEGIAERGRAAREVLARLREDARLVPAPKPQAGAPPAGGADFLWWLEAGTDAAPLTDRVEKAMLTRLRQQPFWTEGEIIRSLYGEFPGILAPETPLLEAALRSYATLNDGLWRLRPEDEAPARIAEVSGLLDALMQLGEQLGYETALVTEWASPWWPCSLCWLEQGRVAVGFALQETAEVGPWLRPSPLALAATTRYILVPASRSGLLAYKLRHVSGWADALARNGWQFAKNRHWRRLAATPGLDRAGFLARAGLDPIVEGEAAQLPLFP